jgi:pyrophosphatase PpaX
MINRNQGHVPEYETYLFDADGTLIDTAALVVTCFEHTLEVYKERLVKKSEDPAAEIMSLMGLPLRYQMELYFGPLTDEAYNVIHRTYSGYQEDIFEEYLKLFPGVAEGLAGLKSAGKKLAIVTSRRMASLRCYTKAMGIDDYFDEFITPEATEKHKPEAEPVLEAMKRFGASRASTVFIGDALFDIQSGKSAGVATVFVGWSHNSVEKLEVRPDFTISSMDELLDSIRCGDKNHDIVSL